MKVTTLSHLYLPEPTSLSPRVVDSNKSLTNNVYPARGLRCLVADSFNVISYFNLWLGKSELGVLLNKKI